MKYFKVTNQLLITELTFNFRRQIQGFPMAKRPYEDFPGAWRVEELSQALVPH